MICFRIILFIERLMVKTLLLRKTLSCVKGMCQTQMKRQFPHVTVYFPQLVFSNLRHYHRCNSKAQFMEGRGHLLFTSVLQCTYGKAFPSKSDLRATVCAKTHTQHKNVTHTEISPM